MSVEDQSLRKSPGFDTDICLALSSVEKELQQPVSPCSRAVRAIEGGGSDTEVK